MALLALVSSIASWSCSFTEFEISPYTPRGVDIVYSQQEDLTFVVWRMGDVVDFDRVHFEINLDGQFHSLELSDAPFASEPYECDRLYWCVQYQIPGQWTPPPHQPPLRAIDARHGIFRATAPRIYEVETTFDIDPVGVDNNRSARPELFDWFDEENVPIRRTFQWGLVPSTAGDPPCTDRAPEQWSTLSSRVSLPQDWMDLTPCMAVRPLRSDRPGDEVRRPLIEGAMLYTEEVDRLLPEIEHPIMVVFLVDLEVVNETRCQQIVDAIGGQIFTTLDEEEITYRELGIYRPTEPGGDPYSGCNQREGSRYPVNEIQVRADQVAATFEEPSTLLIVYLNNLHLPPSAAKSEDLDALLHEQDEEDNPQLFRWAIGSNTVSDAFDWDDVNPWAPIEDENFMPSIESTVKYNFPLKSTDFDGEDSIPLFRPNAAQSPQHFRLCTFSPAPVLVGLPPLAPQPALADTWPWSDEQQPELYFDIPPQLFELNSYFRETEVTGVYEVCDAFCDRPFENRTGQLRDSWLDAIGECQW